MTPDTAHQVAVDFTSGKRARQEYALRVLDRTEGEKTEQLIAAFRELGFPCFYRKGLDLRKIQTYNETQGAKPCNSTYTPKP